MEDVLVCRASEGQEALLPLFSVMWPGGEVQDQEEACQPQFLGHLAKTLREEKGRLPEG